jgi:hypothetical protein
MTEPQLEFYQLKDKYPAFVGGFGTGKTETLANCAIRDGLMSSSALIALYEPTYDLVRLILAPRMEEKLTDMGIRYKYNKQENIIYTSSGQCGDFVLRTLENPARIVGYQSYRAHVDEIDTLKKDQARLAWQKIIARNRQQPDDVADPLNRVSAYTTPEGYRFVYDTWGRNPKKGYVMVQAATYSNPFLPEDYVDTLRDSYPPALIDAYIEGKFTNLTSGSVYPDFDRRLNHTDATLQVGEPVLIGMDFNRLKMSAVIYVMRDGWPVAVDEIVDGRDTPHMVEIYKARYKDKGHAIQVFPDASGQNASSKNASESDLSIIRQAGISVQVNSTNPAIADRVNAVNALILNGDGVRRLKVNTYRCPHLTDGLEQQAYDKNGMPDKSSGIDHVIDAAGYPLAKLFPIVKPVTSIKLGFAR